MNPPRLELLASAFAQHGVRYVIIGGYALVLQGGEMATYDIDVAISYDAANLDDVAAALNSLNPVTRANEAQVIDRFSFGGRYGTFFTDAGIIQVISRPGGYESFEELDKESDEYTFFGKPVKVASLESLKKMKSGTHRHKDEEHLALIEALLRLRANQA